MSQHKEYCLNYYHNNNNNNIETIIINSCTLSEKFPSAFLKKVSFSKCFDKTVTWNWFSDEENWQSLFILL